jgi:hypothetical protein
VAYSFEQNVYPAGPTRPEGVGVGVGVGGGVGVGVGVGGGGVDPPDPVLFNATAVILNPETAFDAVTTAGDPVSVLYSTHVSGPHALMPGASVNPGPAVAVEPSTINTTEISMSLLPVTGKLAVGMPHAI